MMGRFYLVLFAYPLAAVGQDAPLPRIPVVEGAVAAPAVTAPSAATPKGVEVLARGPVHEAFATPTTDPIPTKPIPRKPPAPLDEMPPEEKPEGNATWIGGYWSWDEDRKDFIWVSGTWRSPPPGKQWVPGYWKETGDEWQWASGFWSAAAAEARGKDQVPPAETFLPAPPSTPNVAPPPPPPNVATAEIFYVPGVHVWNGNTYLWRAGYWARVQPGYVWVSAHYRWTPAGCAFIPGYWDLAIARRGVLYAPVVIDPAIRVSYVYTPCYAVHDTLVLDSMFVRPACGHYYFGDYYGPVYRERGYESCVVFSTRHYDPIFVYERSRRPDWVAAQTALDNDRHLGRAPLPPRTLVQQNITINNVTNVARVQGIAPASQMIRASGGKPIALNSAARQRARQQAVSSRQAAVQRGRVESGNRASAPQFAPGAPAAGGAPASRFAPGRAPVGPGSNSNGSHGPSRMGPGGMPSRQVAPGTKPAAPRPPIRPPPPPVRRPPPRDPKEKPER